MNFDLVVKNGVVYTEQGFYKLNVGVQGEKIAVLADPAVPLEGARVIDAQGKYVLPGFIDCHCHLRDPGLTQKEDSTPAPWPPPTAASPWSVPSPM